MNSSSARPTLLQVFISLITVSTIVYVLLFCIFNRLQPLRSRRLLPLIFYCLLVVDQILELCLNFYRSTDSILQQYLCYYETFIGGALKIFLLWMPFFQNLNYVLQVMFKQYQMKLQDNLHHLMLRDYQSTGNQEEQLQHKLQKKRITVRLALLKWLKRPLLPIALSLISYFFFFMIWAPIEMYAMYFGVCPVVRISYIFAFVIFSIFQSILWAINFKVQFQEIKNYIQIRVKLLSDRQRIQESRARVILNTVWYGFWYWLIDLDPFYFKIESLLHLVVVSLFLCWYYLGSLAYSLDTTATVTTNNNYNILYSFLTGLFQLFLSSFATTFFALLVTIGSFFGARLNGRNVKLQSETVALISDEEIERVYQDKLLFEQFKQFSASEWSSENVALFETLKNFSKMKVNMNFSAQCRYCFMIYEEYVKIGSPFEVNMSAHCREKTKQSIQLLEQFLELSGIDINEQHEFHNSTLKISESFRQKVDHSIASNNAILSKAAELLQNDSFSKYIHVNQITNSKSISDEMFKELRMSVVQNMKDTHERFRLSPVYKTYIRNREQVHAVMNEIME